MGWESRFDNKKENKFNLDKKTLKNEVYNPAIVEKFLEDWKKCRDRHSGQQQILDAFFVDEMQYIFVRAGRKFSKTSTNIDIIWKFAMLVPNSVIYYCFPTITQAIEVVWEEKRLQKCDTPDDEMREKYILKTDDSKHMMWFTSGSFVKLVGTWSEARGRGTQPNLLIVDEVQDCSGDYLDAADPNLAAKDGRCIMSGTPPIKENHYHSWEKRISANKRGKIFKFSSYSNDKIPHLKSWLDNKHLELIKADKDDVWKREYLAEDCFSSADRMLPDAKLLEPEKLEETVKLFNYVNRYPVLAVSVQSHYLCAVMAVIIPQKAIFIMDEMSFRQTWKRSFVDMYPLLGDKLKELQDFCGKRMQNLVWDDSQSFQDVIIGFTPCRKDLKWQERGFLLLREMMSNGKIYISNKLEEFGPECQKLLRDEPIKDIEKNYPYICTIAMLVNEYFAMEKVVIKDLQKFDKYQALRDMGIPAPPKKSPRGFSIFRMGD